MLLFSDAEKHYQLQYREFIGTHILPYADTFDKNEAIPSRLFQQIAAEGYLGAVVSKTYGGAQLSPIIFGILCAEFSRGSGSLLSLLTVHSMVCLAIEKWGSSTQKNQWLGPLAKGEILGAFAISEPDIGSDVKNITLEARLDGDSYVLNGKKKWISFGQVADLFLILARNEDRLVAFLIPKDTPGLTCTKINGMYGFRAGMLAELDLVNCRVSPQNIVGSLHFGFAQVVGSILDLGRYCIAWGGVGIAAACAEQAVAYASSRTQFNEFLTGHQLIKKMLADMLTNIRAAELLCRNAGQLREAGAHQAIMETTIAKYFASQMVNTVAADAMQIMGANGFTEQFPVQRYIRDAKVMEIIEGSSQMQQLMIAEYAHQLF